MLTSKACFTEGRSVSFCTNEKGLKTYLFPGGYGLKGKAFFNHGRSVSFCTNEKCLKPSIFPSVIGQKARQVSDKVLLLAFEQMRKF